MLAYGATVFRGDPVVIGIGTNLLASGLTSYLLHIVFGVSGTFGLGSHRTRPNRNPGNSRRPGDRWAFGRQSALTWIAWALTAAVAIVLFKRPQASG